MKTSVIAFPFDLFGSAGTGAGADLLADELREILVDNRRETVATRARAYAQHLKVKSFTFGNIPALENWRSRGRGAVHKTLNLGDRLVWLAGNHLGALPVYDELAGQEDVLVLQLDAHLDVHHFADCSKEPTHGNFLLHVEGKLPPLINVGHRDLLLTPEYIAGFYKKTYSAAELAVDPAGVLAGLRKLVAGAKRVFIDIDCDVWDSAYFPAVSQPVPFGLNLAQVLTILSVVPPAKVAGLIISEFDPARDQADRGLSTLVWLLEHLLLQWHELP